MRPEVMKTNADGVLGLAATALLGLAGCGGVLEETGEAVSAGTTPISCCSLGRVK
jgi:hypothetical protein